MLIFSTIFFQASLMSQSIPQQTVQRPSNSSGDFFLTPDSESSSKLGIFNTQDNREIYEVNLTVNVQISEGSLIIRYTNERYYGGASEVIFVIANETFSLNTSKHNWISDFMLNLIKLVTFKTFIQNIE